MLSQETYTLALNEVKDNLETLFVQRVEEIKAILAGLISGEPTILIGEAGTAKTALVEMLAKLCGTRYFYYLLTKFTEPDEILGMLDIAKLREGIYRRRTQGRLPDAEIVFLDEIFKASSAIRNVLLDIILNRRFFDGERYTPIPLLALYTASNEVSYDVEDSAFYDRITIRKFVDSVGDEVIPKLVKRGIEMEKLDSLKPILGVEEIKNLQNACRQRFYEVANDNNLLKKFQLAVVELRKVGITMSDRRKIKTIKVASALSIIFGEDKVNLRCIGEALKLTAVNEREDVRRVEEVVIDLNEEEVDVLKHDIVINSYIRELKTMEAELRNSINDREMFATVSRRVKDRIEKMPKSEKLKPYVERVKKFL